MRRLCIALPCLHFICTRNVLLLFHKAIQQSDDTHTATLQSNHSNIENPHSRSHQPLLHKEFNKHRKHPLILSLTFKSAF